MFQNFFNKELIRIIQHYIHTAALTYLPLAQDNERGTLTPVTRVRQLSIVTTQRRLLHTVDLPAPETGQTPSTALRHPFPPPPPPPWRRVPESDARSVDTGVLQVRQADRSRSAFFRFSTSKEPVKICCCGCCCCWCCCCYCVVVFRFFLLLIS